MSGCLNSFRQPDFQTYHKTLPLPPKTTVAGMLGAALGISPKAVNDEWLKKGRFCMGIVGESNGKANDLWQIRKYENKQISAFNKFRDDVKNSSLKKEYKITTPYKIAVIVRELLFKSEYVLYLTFTNESDLQLIENHLRNPVWALSLGREDELINISAIDTVQLEEKEDIFLKNTIVPDNESNEKYDIDLSQRVGQANLLSDAPKSVNLPISFSYKNEVREANAFQDFTFISQLPVKFKSSTAFWDSELHIGFQIF
jgi:CRISPR-associated protein Cas5t